MQISRGVKASGAARAPIWKNGPPGIPFWGRKVKATLTGVDLCLGREHQKKEKKKPARKRSGGRPSQKGKRGNL